MLIAQQRDEAFRVDAAAVNRPRWHADWAVETSSGLKALRSFCNAEHSEESVEFIVEASAWRARWEESNDAARKAGADAIIEKFIREGAPLEICVPSGHSKGRYEVYKGTMFDSAMGYARTTLIMDIWPRFEESEFATELRLELLASAQSR
jgi:hypothetical protein